MLLLLEHNKPNDNLHMNRVIIVLGSGLVWCTLLVVSVVYDYD